MTTHIFLTFKTKPMNQQEMIEAILNYKDELQNDYNELCKAFGQQDPATKRNETKLVTMLLLLDKLKLDDYRF